MRWKWKSLSQKEEKRMTYNTRIYNYSNLKSEDKQIVQAQLLIFETVEDRITNSRGRVNRPLHKSKDNHKVCTCSSA